MRIALSYNPRQRLPANSQSIPPNEFPKIIENSSSREVYLVVGYRQAYSVASIIDDSVGITNYFLFNEDKSKICNMLHEQTLCS